MAEILKKSIDVPQPVLLAGPWEFVTNTNNNPFTVTDKWQRVIYRNMESYGLATCRVMTADLRGHRGWIWDIITAEPKIRRESPMRPISLDSAKDSVDKALVSFGIKMIDAKWKVMF